MVGVTSLCGVVLDASVPRPALAARLHEVAREALFAAAARAEAAQSKAVAVRLVVSLGSSLPTSAAPLLHTVAAAASLLQFCYEALEVAAESVATPEAVRARLDAVVLLDAQPSVRSEGAPEEALRAALEQAADLEFQGDAGLLQGDSGRAWSAVLALEGLPGRTSQAVCGGTFDRLHAGHKVLITVTGLLAWEAAVIGVSGDASGLVSGKQRGDLLEPYKCRAARAVALLRLTCPHLPLGGARATELRDALGPAVLPAFGQLVVSEETRAGGAAVNAARRAVGVAELEVTVIGLIAAGAAGKLSSTALREADAAASSSITTSRDGARLRSSRL